MLCSLAARAAVRDAGRATATCTWSTAARPPHRLAGGQPSGTAGFIQHPSSFILHPSSVIQHPAPSRLHLEGSAGRAAGSILIHLQNKALPRSRVLHPGRAQRYSTTHGFQRAPGSLPTGCGCGVAPDALIRSEPPRDGPVSSALRWFRQTHIWDAARTTSALSKGVFALPGRGCRAAGARSAENPGV